MHHVEVSPLLQGLVVLLLLAAAVQAVRVTWWKGRLVLLTLALVCVMANPGRARHVRAIQRAAPEADTRLVHGVVTYHDFLVVSAASVQGRLVSLGGLNRVLVGSISCATLSEIRSSAPPTKGSCAPCRPR